MPELNVSANITFYGIDFGEHLILKDGAECSDCKKISFDLGKKELVIEVPHFTTYEVKDPNAGAGGDDGDGDTGSGNGGSGGSSGRGGSSGSSGRGSTTTTTTDEDGHTDADLEDDEPPIILEDDEPENKSRTILWFVIGILGIAIILIIAPIMKSSIGRAAKKKQQNESGVYWGKASR